MPADADSRLFIDEIGRTVSIPSCPKRIVSLAPNITEALFALGLEGEIVGVTIFCNYPVQALQKPKVGGLINPSLEMIVSLEPDLIIATADGNRKENVEQLEKIGLPVYVVNPVNIDEILTMVMDIGTITGKEKKAGKLVRNLRKRIGNVIHHAKGLTRPKVFLQFGINSMITAGRNTFLNELITTAGGHNIAGDSEIRYPRFNIEAIIAGKPDVIITSSMNGGESSAPAIHRWKRWHDIPAVQNGRIHIMDSDIINRPSPRIVDGLEELFSIIHPASSLNSPRK
jgi:iron complex transport system substrate-binding protein